MGADVEIDEFGVAAVKIAVSWVVVRRGKEEGNGSGEEEMGMATFLGGTRFIFWADIWLLRKTRKTGHRADVDGLSRREWQGKFYY